jgi:hypothetical protein
MPTKKTARFRAALKKKQRRRRERVSGQKRVKGGKNRHPRRKK